MRYWTLETEVPRKSKAKRVNFRLINPYGDTSRILINQGFFSHGGSKCSELRLSVGFGPLIRLTTGRFGPAAPYS